MHIATVLVFSSLNKNKWDALPWNGKIKKNAQLSKKHKQNNRRYSKY